VYGKARPGARPGRPAACDLRHRGGRAGGDAAARPGRRGDGLVLSGDLTQSLGAPVKAGDTLLSVAPAAGAELRLGYEGVAKFEAASRRLGQVLFERPWRALADRIWALGW